MSMNTTTPMQSPPSMPPRGDWMAPVLDEIDYGMLFVGDDGTLLHMNHTARRELLDEHPLSISGGRLSTADPRDAKPWAQAAESAREQSRRVMISMQCAGRSFVMSVVPLQQWGGHGRCTLVILGRRSVCETLSANGYGRCHGLSPMESAVLAGLSVGRRPLEIARKHGVQLSTVRAQIASIRSKTGVASIAELVERVATLPPMVGAPRH